MKNSVQSSGQALLIVLLIMAVVLTIGLSVASRSVTDITVSQKEEDAARAFSAAEAGVEQALKGSTTLSGSFGNNSSYNVGTAMGVVTAGTDFVSPDLVSAGESVTLWFVSHAGDGSLICDSSNPCFTGDQLKVCWGESGTALDSNAPAMEFSALYTTASKDYSTAKIGRVAYDPFAGRTDSNGFTKGSDGTCTIQNQNFQFSKTIKLSDLGAAPRSPATDDKGPQLARIRLFYNSDKSHRVGVVSLDNNALLPQQGIKIVSKGQSGSATRKIEVTQLHADLPPVFDFGVFSGTGGITK